MLALSRLRPLTHIFSRDSKGQVSILMAMLAVPLFVMIGGAVDIARSDFARSRLQAAIDSALLTGMRYLQTNQNDQAGALVAAGRIYTATVNGKLKLSYHTIRFEMSSDGNGMLATGEARIKTPFLSLASVPELVVMSLSGATASEVAVSSGSRAQKDLELSLVLDITGSMQGDRIEALKDAAKDLINIVVSDSQGVHTSRVALVPYSAGVNPGPYRDAVRGRVSGATCNSPGCQSLRFINSLGQWRTLSASPCVSERIGPHAFSDRSPQSSPVGYAYLAAENACPKSTFVPLTSEKEMLIDAIEALQTGGSTGAQVGFAWGWYALSPNWASVWRGRGAGAYDEKTRKIAILFTDGEFNSPYCRGVIAHDATYGSGSPADHINCNAPNGSSYAQSIALCEAMKATGIEVFTIAFGLIDSGDARNVMARCASSPDTSYNTSNLGQLKAAFRDIGLKVVNLYLAR